MKRRNWSNEQKTQIVLEGLRGRSVGEVCSEHGISQAQYYQWRDRFLSGAHKAFETEKPDVKMTKLSRENDRLKNLVGELTLELKKSDLLG